MLGVNHSREQRLGLTLLYTLLTCDQATSVHHSLLIQTLQLLQLITNTILICLGIPLPQA